VSDPKNYRFCGYGEAVAGKKPAREGLTRVLAVGQVAGTWPQKRALYRKQLYIVGEARGVQEGGRPVKPGFSLEKVDRALAEKGQLSRGELLRCRVRYFSDGVAIGSQDFVDDVFNKYREEFGVKRKTGARKMGGGDWGELCTMRDLKLSPITVPT